MLKKVLCVVLSLVLALGAMSVGVFAASADEIAAAVAKLPSDYNAQFYNDETVAAIQAAKAAAASGAANALELCDAAYALVTEEAEDEFGAAYYVNRDESKAVVNYNVSTDTSKVKPGESFDVTVSLSTNFYLGDAMLALGYDSSVLEIAGVTHPDALSGIMTFEPYKADHMKGRYGYVPMEWNYEDADGNIAADKYKLMTIATMNDDTTAVKGETKVFFPQTDTEMFTVTFKVKDNAADGIAKVFIDDTVGYHYFEYETDMDFYEQCFAFTRGWDEILIPNEYSKRYDGTTLDSGAAWIDPMAYYDTTIVYGGTNATPYTSTDIYGGQNVEVNGVAIDMVVASTQPADYSKLEAAVKEAGNYSANDWTPETYGVLADAVEDANNCDPNLTEDQQATIDALEAAIYAAIEGLERQQAAGCPIESITANGEVKLLQYNNFSVVVKNAPAMKVRFVNEAGSTRTYAADNENVKSITDNGDGTETWVISVPASKLEETYTVFVRYADTGWNEIGYVYDMVAVDPEVLDDRFISYDIVDDYEGAIYNGVNTITVVTGVDVSKVQFVEKGNTWTFTPSNSTVVDEDGVRTWTLKMNFVKLGDHSYTIRTRTVKSTFAATGETMDVTVFQK